MSANFLKNNLYKIAFVMQESRMGGIEYNSVHLAKALQGKSNVIFIIPGTGPLSKRLDEEKLPYIICPRPPFFSTSIQIGKMSLFNPFTSLYDFLLFPFLSLKLAKLFKEKKFQLIVTKGLLTNFYGTLAAKISGLPCLWDMQEIVSSKKGLGLMSSFLNFWAKLFVDKIIVSSKAISAQFWDENKKKVEIIPNGIDTNFYHPDVDSQPVRREWGVREGEVLITHIARFTFWKGQKDFVKAAALLKEQIPNVKFALVGSPVFENDDYEKEVRQLARESNLAEYIIFPGFRNDLEKVLAATDIFVHSSIEPEGCPITLITAMGMGKPCVVTNVEGNNEIVNEPGNQALFVEPGNPQGLAEALVKISGDTNLKTQLGHAARERILERYSLDVYASCSQSVFETLVSSR